MYVKLKSPSSYAKNSRSKPPHSRSRPGKSWFQNCETGQKHIVMSDGARFLTIPRKNPINAFTMGGIVKDAGLTAEQFRKLL